MELTRKQKVLTIAGLVTAYQLPACEHSQPHASIAKPKQSQNQVGYDVSA